MKKKIAYLITYKLVKKNPWYCFDDYKTEIIPVRILGRRWYSEEGWLYLIQNLKGTKFKKEASADELIFPID